MSDHWANALKKPWDIAFDCHGKAYDVDCDNFCVRVIMPDSVLLRSIGRESACQYILYTVYHIYSLL